MVVKSYSSVRSLILRISLCLLPCLLLACTTDPTVTPTWHPTYGYGQATCPMGIIYHPEKHVSILEKPDTNELTIKWQPSPGPETSASTPIPITLQAELIGPAPSLESFRQETQPDGSVTFLPDSPVVALTPAIKTTNWTNQTYMLHLQFPDRLAPGYYQVLEIAVISNGTREGARETGRCFFKV